MIAKIIGRTLPPPHTEFAMSEATPKSMRQALMEQADHWVDGGGALPAAKSGPFALAAGPAVLADLRKGRSLKVSHIAVAPDTGHRLTGLGIRKGVELTVLRNAGKGPLLVAVGGTRVGLCRSIAKSITGHDA